MLNINNYENNQQSKIKYDGMVVNTNSFGKAVVVNYINKKKVEVVFLDTEHKDYFWMKDVIKGNIRDNYAKTTCNVGLKGDTSSMQGLNEKHVLYEKWSSMISRCYGKNIRKAYVGCSVGSSFRNYSTFFSWCEDQVGFDQDGWHLDKDILVRGNKVYSESTCCFVPPEINSLILSCKGSRGELPIGVSKTVDGKKYRSRVHSNGSSKFLGVYRSSEEAFFAYKSFKESYIKEVANKWKDRMDLRVYNALMNWEVGIDD